VPWSEKRPWVIERPACADFCGRVHEDAIKIGGATKAPDYCFRIGGRRKVLRLRPPELRFLVTNQCDFQITQLAPIHVGG
jgi:hypothetical protein